MFYMRVLNLCFSDLIVGVIVLPFNISYFQLHNYTWLHGHHMCQAYLIVDITHFGFSGLVITTLCLDRLLTKALELHPEKFKFIKYSQICLFVLPFLFTLCAFLPLLMSSIAITDVVFPQICALIIHDHMIVPTIIVAYLVPIITMILTTVGMLVLYCVKRPVWYQISDSEEATETNTTTISNSRFSLIATRMVSFVTILFWFPYLVFVFIVATCRMRSCVPGLVVFKVTLFLSTLSSLFTPCLWIVDDQIRSSVKGVIRRFRLFCLPQIVRERQHMELRDTDDL